MSTIQFKNRGSGKSYSLGLEVKRMLDDGIEFKIATSDSNNALRKILLDLGVDSTVVENIFIN